MSDLVDPNTDILTWLRTSENATRWQLVDLCSRASDEITLQRDKISYLETLLAEEEGITKIWRRRCIEAEGKLDEIKGV
jgi:hypothetical protein